MRLILRGLIPVLGLAGLMLPVAPARAALPELRIAPLLYNQNLDLGHLKKGYVDLSNPTGSTMHIQMQVQAFRQVLDGGGQLEFYDDPRIAAAVTPLDPEFDLGPRQAVRTFFTIDPNKLGDGGAYAVIFARTSEPGSNLTQIKTSARVGTLLILDVGSGGLRTGQISQINLPWFIYGHHSIAIDYTYANSGTSEKSLAFYPILDAAIGSNHKKVKGPLVFPLRTRSSAVVFELGNHIGPVQISIRDTSGGGGTAKRWVMLVTGYWTWLLPLLILVGLLMLSPALWWGFRTSPRPKLESPASPTPPQRQTPVRPQLDGLRPVRKKPKHSLKWLLRRLTTLHFGRRRAR